MSPGTVDQLPAAVNSPKGLFNSVATATSAVSKDFLSTCAIVMKHVSQKTIIHRLCFVTKSLDFGFDNIALEHKTLEIFAGRPIQCTCFRSIACTTMIGCATRHDGESSRGVIRVFLTDVVPELEQG